MSHPTRPRTSSRTSLTDEVDALARPSDPRQRWTFTSALDASLRAASVFCATTLSMLGLWIVVPTLFLGWSASAIESGSMEPNLTRGDVVLLRPAARHPLAAGAVVRFRLDGASESTVHRIDRVDRVGHTYITRGDANREADSTRVPFDRVDGAGAMLVPVMGYPLLWAEEGNLPALAMLGVGLLVVVGPGLRSRKNAVGEKRAPLRPLTALGEDPAPTGPRPLFPERWVPGGLPAGTP